MRPWLFGVAYVLRGDRERDHRAGATVERLARELDGVQQTPSEADPLTHALTQLSPIRREIIELIVWDQMTPRDVAAVLDLSPNVVRVRAHRARQQLRRVVTSARSGASLPAPVSDCK